MRHAIVSRIRALVICSLVFTSFGYAQDGILRGTVVANRLEDYSVHIFNASSKKGTIQLSDGSFLLPVSVGDTITFSAVHLISVQWVVLPDHLESEIRVPMILKAIELEEITLQDNSLNMFRKPVDQEVINNIKLSLPFTFKETQDSYEQRELNYTQSNWFVGMLMNGSKTREDLEEYIAVSKEETLEKETLSLTSDSLLSKLGIPQQLSSQFIEFCSRDPDFYFLAQRKNYLGIIEIMNKRKKAFLEMQQHDYSER